MIASSFGRCAKDPAASGEGIDEAVIHLRRQNQFSEGRAGKCSTLAVVGAAPVRGIAQPSK